MSDQVVFVQTLHEDHDAAGEFLVEAADERVVVPVVDGVTARVGERFVGLQRVIDDDEIGATSGEVAHFCAWRI